MFSAVLVHLKARVATLDGPNRTVRQTVRRGLLVISISLSYNGERFDMKIYRLNR